MHVKEALIYFVFLKNNSVYLSFSVFCTIQAFILNAAYVNTQAKKKDQIIKTGGLKWTRTTDLTLIRRAL